MQPMQKHLRHLEKHARGPEGCLVATANTTACPRSAPEISGQTINLRTAGASLKVRCSSEVEKSLFDADFGVIASSKCRQLASETASGILEC